MSINKKVLYLSIIKNKTMNKFELHGLTQIKVAKSNTNKQASFLHSCKINLRSIYKLGMEKEAAFEVRQLRNAISDPTIWYKRMVVEK